MKSYYYIVSISFPFRVQSEAEAQDYLKDAEKGKPAGFKGSFSRCSNRQGTEVYMFQFEKSLPASEAKVSDFTLTRVHVATDKLLSTAHTTFVEIDLRLVAVSGVVEATRKRFHDVKKSVDSDGSKKNVTELLSELEEAVLTDVSDVSKQLPVEVPEKMNNNMLKTIVTREAQSMGYFVATDQSTAIAKTRASQFFASRPDLVLYHPDKCHGCIIVDEGTAETESEPSSPTPRVILTAGLTENKLHTTTDVLGQLLGSMEKLAGDLAWMYVTNGSIPLENIAFHQIDLYGLIVNFVKFKCKIYKLKMAFDENSSTLYIGDNELDLTQGIVRLLQTLENTF